VDGDSEARLTLGGLPAGMKLGRGDYIGFRWDAAGSPAGAHDRRTLVRTVLPAMVSGNGTVSVLVEPPVPTLVVPAAAEAHLDRPGCIMKLVRGDSSLNPMDRRLKIAGGTVSAMQDLRP